MVENFKIIDWDTASKDVIDALYEWTATNDALRQVSPQKCQPNWSSHAPGFWANPSNSDATNTTIPLCGHKCNLTKVFFEFELY